MKFTRQEAIDYLVERDQNDIQQMINQGDWTYLDSILRTGFIGYETLTNEELKNDIANSSADDEEIEII